MRVSIIINNFNYACFLNQAIDSALNQTHRNTEVIVVDDGSTPTGQISVFRLGLTTILGLEDRDVGRSG